ncbi:MAG: phosphatase PAP2 family protein [Clostridiales bacterium]|nr:phosphatase PAP2 family protein [Clostridiales bacterium]
MREKLRKLKERYGHIWLAVGYLSIYLPWFCWLEERDVGRYTVVHATLDDYIPFNEYFVIPYLLWFVYVAGSMLYFFLTNRQDYYRECVFLFVGMTISLLICTLFPNGTNLRAQVETDDSLCGRLVELIEGVDTPTNVFPSIHVYNSLGVHFSVMNSKELRSRRGICAGSFVLMVLICLSTVFLKQHSAIDVAGALILAHLIYPLVYGTEYAEAHKGERRKAVN